jgi:hypothetical protein
MNRRIYVRLGFAIGTDAYEILRLKEIELAKVKTEAEALGVAAPPLSDEGDLGADSIPNSTR